jgi:hypothetical protein
MTPAEQVPSFNLPVACTPGMDCWIVNYFDHNPGPGMLDYACGQLSYDSHGGTDYALRDHSVMARGVAVLAVAQGVVKAVRDGMPDVNMEQTSYETIEGRECGNGVLLDLGAGWETQYCHLRRESVAVKPGDLVSAGQMLGMIGLSGRTEFPHLDFSVRYRGRNLDPFIGRGRASGCTLGKAPLWSETALDLQPYLPFALYNSGFAEQVPKAGEVRAGKYQNSTLVRTAKGLVLWIEVFGAEIGDHVTFRIYRPDGSELLSHDHRFAKRYARWFGYAGKQSPDKTWPVGVYRGEVYFRRDVDGKIRESLAVAEVKIIL